MENKRLLAFTATSLRLTATLEVRELGDALDESKMRTLPTKTEYDALDETNDAALIEKFNINKRAMAIIVLGHQNSAQGMAVIDKTKTGGTGGQAHSWGGSRSRGIT
jgi:hypothetical protein